MRTRTYICHGCFFLLLYISSFSLSFYLAYFVRDNNLDFELSHIYIYIILSSIFLFININEAYLFALFLHLSFTLCACKINYFLTRVCLCINASTNTCIMEHVITRGMRTLDGSYFFFFFFFFFFWLIRSRLIISFWQIVTLLLYCSNLD